ncbi:MAG: alcohol dehydrogenase catalytic domain-containing protein [Halanaeroarchaeum sp.]
MQAVALFPDESPPALRVIETQRPTPAAGEALVRTLAVGVDGSDRRIVAGDIGGDPPTGDDHLVLGHEAVGVVEDPNGTDLEAGDVVVPTVRVPTDPSSRVARNGELDMASAGEFHERGITGAHGYMAEYFVSDAEYLVRIPASLADYGFFVEPASLVEKALEQAFAARSRFDWRPSNAMVLGNGNLGLLACARLAADERFDRSYCVGRRDRPDPTVDFIERVGATYVDSRETPPADVPDAHAPIDYLFECTGHPNHALDAVHALAANGVATLQGIPGSRRVEIDAGDFHADLVTHNKALLGVVNSRRRHFEDAADWLAETPDDRLDALVSGRYGFADVESAFADSPETLKSVVVVE